MNYAVKSDGQKHLMVSLKAARVDSGLRQAQVAKSLGISVDMLRKFESDSNDIPRGKLMQLLDLYGVGLDDIFFG